MKVRICPKCKKPNDPNLWECTYCKSSLAETQFVDSNSIPKATIVNIGEHPLTLNPITKPAFSIKRQYPYITYEDETITIRKPLFGRFTPSFHSKPIVAKVSFLGNKFCLTLPESSTQPHIVDISYIGLPIISIFFGPVGRFIIYRDKKKIYEEPRLPLWAIIYTYIPFILFFGGVFPMLIGFSGVYLNLRVLTIDKLPKVVRFCFGFVLTVVYVVLAVGWYSMASSKGS